MATPTSALQKPRLARKTFEVVTSREQFIAGRIFPIFPVDEASGEFPKVLASSLLESVQAERAPNGDYNRGSWKFGSDTYSCEEWGWEEPIDDAQRNKYASFLDLEEIAAMRATLNLLRAREIRMAAYLFNPTTFSGKTAGVSTEWSNAANGDPATDVKTAKMAVWDATGIEPNALVISKKVRENLNVSVKLFERMKYTNAAVGKGVDLSDELIAQALGIDRLIVGGAKYNSAAKGQTPVLTDVWDDEYALVCRVEDSPTDITLPCLGRTFLFTGDSPEEVIVERYRDDRVRGDVVRARHNIHEKVLHLSAGYLLSNITA